MGIGTTIVPGLEHRPFTDSEIKEAFNTFDLDKNRFVGAAEISHILALIGEEVTDEEVDEMIRICDTSGSGQVTYDEFYKMMTSPPPPVPVPAAGAAHKAGEKARRGAIRKYIENHNSTGDASLKELYGDASAKKEVPLQSNGATIERLVSILSGGLNKIKPSQVKKVYKRFQDIDKDKSGAIDFHEFCLALDMDDNALTRQMFRVFDMDDSGTIEVKEFIVVLSRYTTASKTEKIKFAFMMFDENGSGLLERAELVTLLKATSGLVDGLTDAELEDRADKVYEFLNLDRDAPIHYEDFLKLAQTNTGLIFPVDQPQFHLKGVTLPKLPDQGE